jgi:hypothetical protein
VLRLQDAPELIAVTADRATLSAGDVVGVDATGAAHSADVDLGRAPVA